MKVDILLGVRDLGGYGNQNAITVTTIGDVLPCQSDALY